MNRLLVSFVVVTTLSTSLAVAVTACDDNDNGTTPPTTQNDSGANQDSGTDAAQASNKGNVVLDVRYTGTITGKLTCLVLNPETGSPVQLKEVASPTFPQRVEANNITPGDYLAGCYIDSNGNDQPDDADPTGPVGAPAEVTIKAGETANVTIEVSDPAPTDDAGSDG